MGSMKGKRAKIDAAFERLADMINGGHLLASTDPVGFLETVAAELKEFRAENLKIRDLMSIEADKHNERQIMLQDTMEQLGMYKCEVASLKCRIEQLEKEKANLYDRCLENEEAMYEAVINGNDNHLIELVDKGVRKI